MLSAFTSDAYIQVHLRQDFFMEANNMSPYQSGPGPYCSQYRLPKNISRREEQTTKFMTGRKRVKQKIYPTVRAVII